MAHFPALSHLGHMLSDPRMLTDQSLDSLALAARSNLEVGHVVEVVGEQNRLQAVVDLDRPQVAPGK